MAIRFFIFFYGLITNESIECFFLKQQNVQERNIGYDPLFISSLLGNEFFLIGGTNKQVIVYTVEGIALDTITTKESWIWCCKAHGNRMV